MNGSEWRDIDPNCNEDMKAAIYAWGGPKPSLISRTKLDFNPETQEMMILFIEKRHDKPGLES